MIQSANRPTLFANTTVKTKSSAAKTASASPSGTGGFGAELKATTAETGTAATTPTKGEPMNVFSRASVENHMNNWLIDLIGQQNAAKTSHYQLAMENWKLNDARCRELGLESPAPPEPPALEQAEAMPEGWWFATNA